MSERMTSTPMIRLATTLSQVLLTQGIGRRIPGLRRSALARVVGVEADEANFIDGTRTAIFVSQEQEIPLRPFPQK